MEIVNIIYSNDLKVCFVYIFKEIDYEIWD